MNESELIRDEVNDLLDGTSGVADGTRGEPVNPEEFMDRFVYTPGRRYSMHTGPVSHLESPS